MILDMPPNYLNNSNDDLIEKKYSHLVELLYGVIAICFIIWIIVYVQVKSVQNEEIYVAPIEKNRGEMLSEVSQNLEIQEQTPQFKVKLEEISRSLNKK